ncbi:MAG: amylosucrase [Chloroflexi bacterium HGW-Chloroflexi-10]|nr:MAG: amylosucrase [Chloroflexi bacterium HGW-Chloroflexi-10]
MPQQPDENLYAYRITRERLFPRLKNHFAANIHQEPSAWQAYFDRLEIHFPRLFKLYYQLYARQFDFYYHLEDLLISITRMWLERSAELKDLDENRLANPDWFQSNQMLGGVCYVDRFAGNLQGLRKKIPYFQELGLTYLHLMPLYEVPEGENDGGYAVTSYRQVDPRLGSMAELRELTTELRAQGISLVLDLIYNHTADNHIWAQKALAGDQQYQNYYLMFPDRTVPDAYERTLREIFPEEHPGAFTYNPQLGKWVWTTFHSYQWDLNYANPEVFNRMAEEMLFVANIGVEVLRLDAVAFTWKEMGTGCENLPEAHLLIQAFNAVARIAAPVLLFKSEAIVHPDEVVKYIKPQECQLSYNPLLMALLWNTLATRQTNLLTQALQQRYHLPSGTTWVNYIRCHDDIGWTFSDEDAAQLNINGYDHRQFLNQFYTGRFEGSFSRGLPFQENMKTGDMRICGTAASLAGLEKALNEETDLEVNLAIKRILLMHSVILTAGGIPLIYLGDETAMMNDYSYHNDAARVNDSRWVHRPLADWEWIEKRNQPGSIPAKMFQGLQQIIHIRKENKAFSDGELEAFDSGNQHVLSFVRSSGAERVLVLANFSEKHQVLPSNLLRLYGLSYRFENLVSGQITGLQEIELEPYTVLLLASRI